VTYTLGMFPLSTVLFPEAGLPLHVFEDRYRRLMGTCLESDGEFGVVLIARGSEVGGGDERVGIGTVARIANVAELDDGRMLVVATGVRRVQVSEWLPDSPFPCARVEDLPDGSGSCPGAVLVEAEGSLRRLRSLLSELGDVPALPHSLRISGDPDQVGWQLCDMAPLVSIDLQRLLAADGLEARMRLLVDLCDAMTGDVVGLLSGGEVGDAGDGDGDGDGDGGH
jgi:Lon protease-like protein